MHRLLSTKLEICGECPVLSREALNHLKVLRPKNGETIELFDGNGTTRVFRYSLPSKSLEPVAEPVFSQRPRRSSLTLFACVTKASRWDWMIEKATELGVDAIVPVISARTVVRIPSPERSSKRERWQRITEEAARQSDAAYISHMHDIVDFEEAVEMSRQTKCYAGALLDRKIPTLADALSQECNGSGSYSVFIGPEGDFTESEMASLLESAVPVTFGPRILRAETAAIYAISVMTSVLDSKE